MNSRFWIAGRFYDGAYERLLAPGHCQSHVSLCWTCEHICHSPTSLLETLTMWHNSCICLYRPVSPWKDIFIALSHSTNRPADIEPPIWEKAIKVWIGTIREAEGILSGWSGRSILFYWNSYSISLFDCLLPAASNTALACPFFEFLSVADSVVKNIDFIFLCF